jgi:hypothetical protein
MTFIIGLTGKISDEESYLLFGILARKKAAGIFAGGSERRGKNKNRIALGKFRDREPPKKVVTCRVGVIYNQESSRPSVAL